WDKVALVLGAEDQSQAAEIECAVRWIRDGRYGLEFAHETQVDCDRETLDELLRQVIRNSFPGVDFKLRAATPVEAEEPEDKRGGTRHPMIWNGILHHDYEWEVVRLRNISRLGALIECPAKPPAGVTVYLDLAEAGKIAATVSWSRGDQCGLSFHEPFDVRSLARIAPDVAARQGYRSPFGEVGQSDQSPWAPQWDRLSLDELGKNLGR
ncbi:MAG: PilZ domain-containing protein, partial [Sphingomicrobium sp.]